MKELDGSQVPVNRRSYSPQLKSQIVEAWLGDEAGVPTIALAFDLNTNMANR